LNWRIEKNIPNSEDSWVNPQVTDSVVDFRVFLAADGLPAVAQGPMTELGASTVEKTEFLVVEGAIQWGHVVNRYWGHDGYNYPLVN
jgi:hypothetical protein